MDDGLEGWIQTQYIGEQPIAALQLAKITRERDDLQRSLEELQERLQQAVAVRNQLSVDNDQLAQESAGLKRELQRITQLASDTISIDRQNQSLV